MLVSGTLDTIETSKGDVFMDYIISTDQLTKSYKRFTAVNHVSLHIQKGTIYGFLGPASLRL